MELASVVIPEKWVNAWDATGTFELPVLELSSHMAAITRAAPTLPTGWAARLASWQGSPTAALGGSLVPLHDPGVSAFELADLAGKGAGDPNLLPFKARSRWRLSTNAEVVPEAP